MVAYNLIFCSTTFCSNRCNQAIFKRRLLPLSTYFGPLLMSKQLQLCKNKAFDHSEMVFNGLFHSYRRLYLKQSIMVLFGCIWCQLGVSTLHGGVWCLCELFGLTVIGGVFQCGRSVAKWLAEFGILAEFLGCRWSLASIYWQKFRPVLDAAHFCSLKIFWVSWLGSNFWRGRNNICLFYVW